MKKEEKKKRAKKFVWIQEDVEKEKSNKQRKAEKAARKAAGVDK